MDRAEFFYELPEALIAQAPLPQRSGSRLLVLDGTTGRIEDRRFTDLLEYLNPGDLLVFNDTRVLPARVHGRKRSGGRVELLLERVTGADRALVQIKASKSPRAGAELRLADGAGARVEGRHGGLFTIRLDRPILPYLETHGEVPLPPYIARAADAADAERYQTVYARAPGAVAAPTAGLHFDELLLAAVRDKGIETGFLTLHVGAGTFSPVRSRRVEDHELHPEWIQVTPALCDRVTAARDRGGRVVAVGTTAVRSLETAALNGKLRAFEGDSQLFIYPGFEFRVVDAMITNFHLPESSLLMLVAAFAGQAAVMRAYRHAVRQAYRFFSYGDAMFVTPAPGAVEAGDAV